MKKLVNDPQRVAREMLEGLCDLHPGLALLQAEDGVVVRADLPPPAARMVVVLTGGGAGHEPAHACYVGPWLLANAIAGNVFTRAGPLQRRRPGRARPAAGRLVYPFGSIVLARFPFTDLTGDKRRPALVVSRDNGRRTPCCIDPAEIH